VSRVSEQRQEAARRVIAIRCNLVSRYAVPPARPYPSSLPPSLPPSLLCLRVVKKLQTQLNGGVVTGNSVSRVPSAG
jgi:hypothetical protein